MKNILTLLRTGFRLRPRFAGQQVSRQSTLSLLGLMVIMTNTPAMATEEKKTLREFEQQNIDNQLLDFVKKNNLEKAIECLKKGANVNCKNHTNMTPLMFTCYHDNIELAKLLIKHGADVNLEDYKNATILMYACTFGSIKLAKLLIKKGAHVNAQDNKKNTPLILACAHGHIELAKLLIKKGAHVNAQSSDNDTPLILACAHGHIELAEILIKNGADVNAQNSYNDTALTHACRFNRTEIAKLLINNGANIYTQNNDGHTAFDVASQNNHLALADYLQEVQNEVNNFKKNPTKWPVKAPLIPHVPKSICLNLLYLNLLSFSYCDISTCLALLEKDGKENKLFNILKAAVFYQKSKTEQKELGKSGFPVNDKEYTLKRNLLENKNNNRFTNIVFARNN